MEKCLNNSFVHLASILGMLPTQCGEGGEGAVGDLGSVKDDEMIAVCSI